MVHRAQELVYTSQEFPLTSQASLSEAQWDALFQAFTEEIGGDPEDGLHTVGTGKRIFEAIRATPPQLSAIVAESSQRLQLSGTTSYVSRPDLAGNMEGRRFTVDFKYTESKWRSASSPWPIKPLLPYDDQLLGQAICSEADGFIKATIRINPQSGKLADIVYEERLVDRAARQEWLAETRSTVDEIESWLMRIDPKWNLAPARPWPKNEDACNAYGKPCPALQLCKAGWKLTSHK